jgi:hypothetical protein
VKPPRTLLIILAVERRFEKEIVRFLQPVPGLRNRRL